jgi:hypothetical protein
MAKTIISEPDEFPFVYNPVAYTIQESSGPGTPIGIKLFAKVLKNGTYEEIINTSKYANDDNETEFYFNRVLKDILAYQLPDFDSGLAQGLYDICKPFYIEWDVLGGAQQSQVRYAVLGAHRYEAFPTRATDFPDNQAFLTNRPLQREVTFTQKEFIYVLPKEGTSCNLVATIVYKDGSSDVLNHDFGSIPGFMVTALPIGFADRDYLSVQSKPIRYVDIAFSDTALSGVQLRLLPVTYNSPWQRTFYYFNRLGGLDSLITTGKANRRIKEVFNNVSRKYLPVTYQVHQGQYEQDVPEVLEEFTIRTGFKKKAEFDAILDIIKYKQLYEYKNGRVLRCIVTDTNTQLPKDGDYKYAFQFSYHYAYHNL